MHSFTKQETTNISIYDVMNMDDVLTVQQISEIHEFANKVEVVPAYVGASENPKIDPTIRRSSVKWLSDNVLPIEVFKLFETMFMSANEYYKFHLLGMEALQYTIYESTNAGNYNWHIDTHLLPDSNVRKLSVSILLSDPNEFEGGKLLLFPNGQHIVAEEKKGRAIFFPSWVPHCVTPVTKGIRKSLVIWAHGPMFK